MYVFFLLRQATQKNKNVSCRTSKSCYAWCFFSFFFFFFHFLHSLTHSLCKHLSDINDGSPDMSLLHAVLDFSWFLSIVLTQKIYISLDWSSNTPFATCTGFHNTSSDTTCPEDHTQWPANWRCLFLILSLFLGRFPVHKAVYYSWMCLQA